jgi:hypothetical protein
VDASCFLRKVATDVLGVRKDVLQECRDGMEAFAGTGDDGRRRPNGAIRLDIAPRDLGMRDLGDIGRLAHRACDQPIRSLPIEILPGREPTLEAMARRAGELENDHDRILAAVQPLAGRLDTRPYAEAGGFLPLHPGGRR